MPIRVSPTEPEPTHHVSLRDRNGLELGLILCDEKGNALRTPSSFLKNPIETTALKQTSGNSSYDIFDYPYNPIVQDDLSGGRGSQDFERDSTKYYDSFRTKSGRANKAYAGPLETYASGGRDMDQSIPGSVKWHTLIDDARHIYKRFTASASYTAALAWLLVRITGTPSDLTIAVYSDSAGDVGSELDSVTVASTRMDDILSEWLCETISQALTSSTAYWVVVYAASTDNSENHWKIGVKDASGTTYYSGAFDNTPTGADFDLYYRLTDANATRNCIPFTYKEQQYFVVNESSGAPSLYMAGDRGAADSNSGQLTKLIDATKSWTADEWIGSVVVVIAGTGLNEPQPWRIITDNDATSLTVDSAWTITHDTTTVYVILGTKLTEITGHGLTAPVTDVLVSTQEVIYFAQGPSVNIRRARFYNNAGTWTREYAADGTNKGNLFAYMPLGKKIVLANNNNSGSVTIAIEDTVPAWGTDITFATAINVDSKYIRINGLLIYPNSSGTETIWIYKENGIWVHAGGTGEAEEASLKEFRAVRSQYAGVRPLLHNVYMYFPLQYGLERYYGSQYDDIGPNLGEGLPANRRGPIVWMVGYPGKFFAAIDAGSSGYSSILDSDGWHERYRAPLGQQIKSMTIQTIPGTTLDRLWVYQGNDMVYLPMPSETPSELEDANYLYAPEFSVTLARMHAGMFDVQKMIKTIKLQTENLEVDASTNEPICYFELDYKLDGDTAWTTFDDVFKESPTQSIDLAPLFGMAGRRVQFRVRGYTTDNTKTPILLAIIINAVIRTDVKYMYPLFFRLMDKEPLLSGEEYEPTTAAERLKILEDWADASSDSMLKMRSVSPLFDDKLVFLNPPTTRMVRWSKDADNEFQKDVYTCQASVQEA